MTMTGCHWAQLTLRAQHLGCAIFYPRNTKTRQPMLVLLQAMGATWHPECFTCEMCNKELADLGFVKNQGRALCHECNAKVRRNLSSLTIRTQIYNIIGALGNK